MPTIDIEADLIKKLSEDIQKELDREILDAIMRESPEFRFDVFFDDMDWRETNDIHRGY